MKAKKLFPDITFKKLLNKQVDTMYPVGSIYMSINDTSPSVLFGGTWEQIKDTFLLSAGDTYEAGATGGEASHTLTVNEIPSHSHSMDQNVGWPLDSSNGNEWGVVYERGDATHPYTRWNTTTRSTGGSQPHNNMPPYLAVYVWKRTA